ncbi:MAG: HEPN domain-containing protein [Bryobacteraceae bacterium]|nr:HEPN domain-containing protein [Bryobacteraceae bacterium]
MPTRYAADDPREWLNRAGCNFFLAKTKTPRVYNEELCFNLHETAQKALKGVLVDRKQAVPATRNLEALIALIGEDTALLAAPAKILAPYETGAEYPSTLPPVTDEEYETAMEAAHQILEWARETVQAVNA